mmetsp:Transcript_6188/g.15022  ORF Transcript_6188/g.15022 Transcript_6188/m.15022 type:complete len:93 (-) Transcript_6188:46-324(-)
MDFCRASILEVPWQLRVMITVIVGQNKGSIGISGVLSKKMAAKGVHKETRAVRYLVANIRRIHFGPQPTAICSKSPTFKDTSFRNYISSFFV